MRKTRAPDEALGLVLERVESTLAQATREGIFPHAAPSATGIWEGTPQGMWTGGFWAGLLWHRAAATGKAEDAATAVGWTRRLSPHLNRTTHDIGFVFSSAAVPGVGDRPGCRVSGPGARGRGPPGGHGEPRGGRDSRRPPGRDRRRAGRRDD